MSVPETMTVIEITEPGGPEVLKPAKRPVPQPGAGQVLIKTAAAGVNRPDVVQRYGLYPAPPGAPDWPGLEVAGEVVALGPQVSDIELGIKLGGAVCALVAGGGYAEYVLADAPLCLPVPTGLSMVEAAALPETFFTVWTNVFERSGLQPGESVLIHGGSSGIGTTAIQLAKAFGARVYATAGSADKVRTCEALGADKAVDYKAEDFVAVLKEAEPKGVNLVLDMVGGDYVQRNIEVLGLEGRLVNIAFLQGAKVEVNLLPVMLKRLHLTGSTLRPRSVAEKASIAEALKARVWPLLEAGTVKPVIDGTYPLAEAAQAHARMESSVHIGKIMLTV